MIIFAAGLRSSGSTVQYQIAKELIESQNLGFGLILNKGKNIERWFINSQKVVVKSHKVTHVKYIKSGYAQILMTVRDLRDVACSLMKRWKYSFDDILPALGKFVKQQQAWTQFTQYIYVNKYEFWHKDLFQETLNIAAFLNVDISTTTADVVASKYSIVNNKLRLGSHHIIDGTVGKYQKMLTTQQINTINFEWGEWLNKYGYI